MFYLDVDGVYEVKEIAHLLHVTPHTVNKWIREDKLRAVKIGNRYTILGEDLKAYLMEKHG